MADDPPRDNGPDQDAHIRARKEWMEQNPEQDAHIRERNEWEEQNPEQDAQVREWKKQKDGDGGHPAASDASMEDASLDANERREVLDFGGARSEWSPEISKKEKAAKKKLSPSEIPEFVSSQSDLDDLVGSGGASYFRKEDQAGYIKRIDDRRATASDVGLVALEAERERAVAGASAIEFLNGGTSQKEYRERGSRRKREEAFGMSMAPQSAQVQYKEVGSGFAARSLAWKVAGDTALTKEADVNEPTLLSFGRFPTPSRAPKLPVPNTVDRIDATYKPTATSELDTLVSGGLANYITPKERGEYKERIDTRISSAKVAISSLDSKMRKHDVSESTKKKMGAEKAEIAAIQARDRRSSTMAVMVESVIAQIKSDTSKKGLTKADKETIARKAIAKAYTSEKILKDTRAGMKEQMRKRSKGLLGSMESVDPRPIGDITAAASHTSTVGVKNYTPISEPMGQTHGPGGKSAKKFAPAQSIFGAASTDPEIERQARRADIDETYSNLVRAANEGDVKKYKIYKDSYRSKLEQEKDDKTYIKSRPTIPKIGIKVGGKPVPRTEDERKQAAILKGQREAEERVITRKVREAKEVELGIRVPIIREGKQVGTEKVSDVRSRLRKLEATLELKTKRDRDAAEAEEARLKEVGSAAPWLAGLSFGKAAALEPQVEEILASRSTAKGANVPVPEYEGGVFKTGEIVGVQSKARQAKIEKAYLAGLATFYEKAHRVAKTEAAKREKAAKESAEAKATFIKLMDKAEAQMTKADKEEAEERKTQRSKFLEGKLKQAFVTESFHDKRMEEAQKRRETYGKTAPFGTLVLQAEILPRLGLGTKIMPSQTDDTRTKQKMLVNPKSPWNRNVGPDGKPLPPPTKTPWGEAWDELNRGRAARATPRGVAPQGFLYGGGLQPVGVTPRTPMGYFPKKSGAPKTIPNPLAHSELMHFGRPFGLVKPVRVKSRRAARRAVIAARKKDARYMAKGGGSFLDRMFW